MNEFQQTPIQMTDNEKLLWELNALNNNIAQLLAEQRQNNVQLSRMATDIKSIKTVATFFLIIAIIALFPLFFSIMGTCVKLL